MGDEPEAIERLKISQSVLRCVGLVFHTYTGVQIYGMPDAFAFARFSRNRWMLAKIW